MFKLAKLIKGGNVQTLAIGVGIAVIAPLALSMANGTLRPLARSLVKTGLQLGSQVKAVTAEARESFDDMIAEVQDEISTEQQSVAEHSAEAPVETTDSDEEDDVVVSQ